MAVDENECAGLHRATDPTSFTGFGIDAGELMVAAPFFIEGEERVVVVNGGVENERELLVRPQGADLRVAGEIPLQEGGGVRAGIADEDPVSGKGGRCGVGKI